MNSTISIATTHASNRKIVLHPLEIDLIVGEYLSGLHLCFSGGLFLSRDDVGDSINRFAAELHIVKQVLTILLCSLQLQLLRHAALSLSLSTTFTQRFCRCLCGALQTCRRVTGNETSAKVHKGIGDSHLPRFVTGFLLTLLSGLDVLGEIDRRRKALL